MRRHSRRISGSGKAMAKWEKYENKSLVKTYDTRADSTLLSVPKKRKFEEDEVENEVITKKIKLERTVDEEEAVDEDTQGKVKKKKKKKNKHANDSASLDTTQDSIGTPDVGSEKKKKKKKKKIKEEPESD